MISKRRHALAWALSLTPWTTAHGSDGHSGCPCLTTFPAAWAQRYVTSGCQEISDATYTGNTGGGTYCYSTDYGLSNCRTWDQGLQPFCTQTPPPSWCSDQWCYVNVSDCTASDATPSIRTVPGSLTVDTPHYSYQTCGITSDLANFAKFQRAALKSAREIVTTVGGYVAEMRDYIERQADVLNSDETGSCPGFVDSCSCSQCQTGMGTWQSAPGVTSPGYSVDFNSLTVTHYDGTTRSIKSGPEQRAQCLSQLVQSKFKSIARLEYNDPARMAFLQYGDQASGVYFSWPGTTFCPSAGNPYDPRFRPWFVSAVSGPKDVVIIMDKSGSMRQQNRWPLAQAAAKEVLGTLTDFDHAGVVMFSSTATTFEDTSVLQEITQAKLQSMKEWIDDQIPAGNTDFRAGFSKAFSMLASSRTTATSSSCNKIILFLTDGEDTSNLGLSELRGLNSQDVTIFTYSFGSGADKARPKSIACQNNGIWYHANDGADIGRIMSGYYMYYAGALARTKQLRWTFYKELTTRNDLITGCLPAYDRRVQPPHLLGVVCMDVSVVMDVNTFKGKADYQAARDEMVRTTSTCNMVNHNLEAVEALRRAVAAESSCDVTTSGSVNSVRARGPLLAFILAALAPVAKAL